VEEENILKKCIENLKVVEASRAELVTQLKQALHEQASICFYVLHKILYFKFSSY